MALTGKEVKLQLMLAAAPLAAAVVQKTPTLSTVDDKDPAVAALNVMECREYEDFYNYLLQCYNLETGIWADPTVPVAAGGSAPAVAGVANALNGASPAVLALLGGLISKIPGTAEIKTAADLLGALTTAAGVTATPVVPAPAK